MTRRNDIYATIREAKGGISRDELADELDLSQSEVEPHLRALLADHQIFELSVGTIGGDRFAAVD